MSGPEGYPYRTIPFGEDRERLAEEPQAWTEWEASIEKETLLSREETDLRDDHVGY